MVVTGSSGLIGTALAAALEQRGDQVTRLVRSEPAAGAGEAHWDPAKGEIDATAFEGQDAVVHLAGVGIGDHRWSETHKSAVLESRVLGTTLLARTLGRMDSPPPTLVSASAVGYYGDRGDEVLTEDSGPGTGFLTDVCRRWETATTAAADAGVRVVHARTGIVLSAAGGALKQMLLPFKLGLGGRIGSGRQWWSWIAIDDEVGAILHAAGDATVRGPLNLTAPEPATNEEFTRTLNRVLHRPTLLPTPTFALKAMFGREAVDEMFLGGQRAVPERLQESGYRFAFPSLEGALRHVLHKGA
jgi:uncharacterized protein